MKVIFSAKPFALIVFSGLSLVLPSANYAQAPAGPLPAAPAQPGPPSASSSAAKPQEQTPQQKPRTVILGGWKLNRDESDDLHKKTQEARSPNGGGGGDGGRRGGMGGGYPGGPQGGYGGGGGANAGTQREKKEQLYTVKESLLTRGCEERGLT